MGKRMGIVTRDCAGINAAIRSAVRTAYTLGIEPVGIYREYKGLIHGEFTPLTWRSVAGIINLGGTILKSARCEEFRTRQGQEKARAQLAEQRIDSLLVIGGNGSLTGAHEFSRNFSFPVMGVPATIDNDVNHVEMTIGADTAVNVALDALDKIRDTSTSLERIFVVEVMGRNCGYIASRVALAGGCEDVLLPERDFDIDKMAGEILEGHKKGKISWIVIVAEGKAKASDIAREITQATGLETREVVLGHIQRGGKPTAFDRIIAARMAHYAVTRFARGFQNECVSIQNGELRSIDLEQAIQPKDIDAEGYYSLIRLLT
ncbi:MAG: ATP-dependent 6-phosphofructokinase [Candidatus Omnitrophica bacterium]|nr:ATP-dependent 6-phosphofructokinase [Candidatus Omnitrophota bacterium]